MGLLNGIEAAQTLREQNQKSLIFLTMHLEIIFVRQALRGIRVCCEELGPRRQVLVPASS
jgi:hypothetical protein